MKLILKITLNFLLFASTFSLREGASASTVFSFLAELTNGMDEPKPEQKKDSEGKKVDSFVVDLRDPKNYIESSGVISSSYFTSQKAFPELESINGKIHSIEVDSEYFRVNQSKKPTEEKKEFQGEKKDSKEETAKQEKEKLDKDKAVLSEKNAAAGLVKEEGKIDKHEELIFSFRARGAYIFYSNTEGDPNVIGSIIVKSIADSSAKSIANNLPTCFDAFDAADNKFHICLAVETDKKKFLCSFQKYLVMPLLALCEGENKEKEEIKEKKENLGQTPKKEEDSLINPVVLIPLQSRRCNHGWNYLKQGKDWECTCAEGKAQSPVNLPEQVEAVETKVKPIFAYKPTSNFAGKTEFAGLVKEGEPYKLRFKDNALRIYAENFGKVTTLDGSVYIAQEIVIHTPSQHKIGGKLADIEVEVVHYGKSIGDLDKQLLLCVLFKKKPAAVNKFFDAIGYMDLPNPVDDVRQIDQPIHIPDIFSKKFEEKEASSNLFSFFYYEGSLTTPPCSERTQVFVVSDVLPIASMTIELLKAALKKPDRINSTGDLTVDEKEIGENARECQPIGERIVYHYDCAIEGCKTEDPDNLSWGGHFEKVEKTVKEIVKINSPVASGVPGSIVISEDQALGKEPLPNQKQSRQQ